MRLLLCVRRPQLAASLFRASSTFARYNQSLAVGPSDPPLLDATIPQHFSNIVSQFGDRPAIIARTPTAQGKPPPTTLTLSYEQLDFLSNALASSLRSLGVTKGDRVAVSLGNTIEFAILIYAIFKLGAVLVPLNPTFNAAQVTAALSHLEVKALVIGAVTDLAFKPTRGRNNLPLLQTLVPDLQKDKIEAPDIPSLKHVVLMDNSSFHNIKFPLLRALTPYVSLTQGSRHRIIPTEPLDPDDTINIQFTSGTTSQPKAAMLSHRGILNNGFLVANRMGLVPTDRMMVPPPLFHCFGSVLGYMATATTGASILFASPAFDPVASLEMATEHNATGIYGVSTMLVAMLDRLEQGLVRRVPTGLQKGIVSGSSIPEALMTKLFDQFGLRDLVIAYGMTETSPVSCMTTPQDPFERRTSSVGRAMPHTAVKIVDSANRDRVLPIGERGELAASGYLVMKGYWGDEVQTREVRTADFNGTVWMHSGDEAYMDADGFVHITGRIKDLIIRGGENIYPLEIENCLFQHPYIGDVSVVGVPDAQYGECVAAFVIPKPGVFIGDHEHSHGHGEGNGRLTEEIVQAFVRERLSGYLIPKHVWFVQDFPKTASGKIQKYRQRTIARKNLGLADPP